MILDQRMPGGNVALCNCLHDVYSLTSGRAPWLISTRCLWSKTVSERPGRPGWNVASAGRRVASVSVTWSGVLRDLTSQGDVAMAELCVMFRKKKQLWVRARHALDLPLWDQLLFYCHLFAAAWHRVTTQDLLEVAEVRRCWEGSELPWVVVWSQACMCSRTHAGQHAARVPKGLCKK